MGQLDATVANPAAAAVARAGALLRACRPRQWSKNVLVAAAPGAAGVISHGDAALDTLQAFVVLCLLSSATYLVNDVRDVAEDRHHPRKRLRPIAAGELSPAAALRAAAVMAAAGLTIAFTVRPLLGVVAVSYLALTGAYSLRLRRLPWIELLTIAGGFLLRAIAGGAAAEVGLSRWFLLVITLGALFVAAGKRLSELLSRGTALRATGLAAGARRGTAAAAAGSTAAAAAAAATTAAAAAATTATMATRTTAAATATAVTAVPAAVPAASVAPTPAPLRVAPARATLARYTPRTLAALAGVAALGMCVAYGVWALRRPENVPYYGASLLALVLWLGRYGVLMARGRAEAPEEVVLTDPLLLTAGAGWLALVITAVYAH